LSKIGKKKELLERKIGGKKGKLAQAYLKETNFLVASGDLHG